MYGKEIRGLIKDRKLKKGQFSKLGSNPVKYKKHICKLEKLIHKKISEFNMHVINQSSDIPQHSQDRRRGDI